MKRGIEPRLAYKRHAATSITIAHHIHDSTSREVMLALLKRRVGPLKGIPEVSPNLVLRWAVAFRVAAKGQWVVTER